VRGAAGGQNRCRARRARRPARPPRAAGRGGPLAIRRRGAPPAWRAPGGRAHRVALPRVARRQARAVGQQQPHSALGAGPRGVGQGCQAAPVAGVDQPGGGGKPARARLGGGPRGALTGRGCGTRTRCAAGWRVQKQRRRAKRRPRGAPSRLARSAALRHRGPPPRTAAMAACRPLRAAACRLAGRGGVRGAGGGGGGQVGAGWGGAPARPATGGRAPAGRRARRAATIATPRPRATPRPAAMRPRQRGLGPRARPPRAPRETHHVHPSRSAAKGSAPPLARSALAGGGGGGRAAREGGRVWCACDRRVAPRAPHAGGGAARWPH
jgi:hypothetical protein